LIEVASTGAGPDDVEDEAAAGVVVVEEEEAGVVVVEEAAAGVVAAVLEEDNPAGAPGQGITGVNVALEGIPEGVGVNGPGTG
jgi:hypothetical protein